MIDNERSTWTVFAIIAMFGFLCVCLRRAQSELLLPTKVQQPLKSALIDESFTHYILLNYMELILLLFKEEK